MNKPEKILIVKPSALGDVVMAMPALRCLSKSFPDAKISWFIRPEYAAVVENSKYLDKIIFFNRKKLGKWWYSPSAFAELWRLIWKLRREKFDVVIDFQGRFRSATFAWFSGCKKRIGIKDTQEITSLFYNEKVAPDRGSYHLVDHYIKMACVAGAKECDVDYELIPSPEAVQSLNEKLALKNIEANNYMVFVLSSAVESKCWPVENFAVLADKIWEKYNIPIVTTGMASERDVSEQLQVLTDANIINFAGDTSIAELIAMLAGAKMVVSGDTGPGHIASAFDVPLVMMFGQTNPNRVGPYGRSDCVVAIDADGRGDFVESNYSGHDVTNITVEIVFEKVCSQFNIDSEQD